MNIKIKLLSAVSAAAMIASVLSGCSIGSNNMSLDVKFGDKGKMTATVKLSDIDTSEFMKDDSNKLSDIKLYYAYSSDEKKSALAGYASFRSDLSGSPLEIGDNAMDGVLTISVSDEENAAFRADPKTEWEISQEFELPEELWGKNVDFLMVASGRDYSDFFAEPGSNDGWVSSGVFSFQVPDTRSTNISYDVEPGYTVTIPSSIELGQTLPVSVGDVLVEEDQAVNVRITETSEEDNTFKLRNGEADLTYTVTNKTESKDVALGDILLSAPSATESKTAEISFNKPETSEYAGTFIGNVTFTFSVDTLN